MPSQVKFQINKEYFQCKYVRNILYEKLFGISSEVHIRWSVPYLYLLRTVFLEALLTFVSPNPCPTGLCVASTALASHIPKPRGYLVTQVSFSSYSAFVKCLGLSSGPSEGTPGHPSLWLAESLYWTASFPFSATVER